jgi:hypothetical protein
VSIASSLIVPSALIKSANFLFIDLGISVSYL